MYIFVKSKMAYRRRQGLSRSSTFNEGILRPRDHQDDTTTSSAAAAPSSPLAPQPNKPADPRLHSFQSSGAFHASFKNRTKSGFVEKKGSATTYDHTSMKSTNEPGGFWGVIARKAKSILDNGSPKQSNSHSIAKPEAVSFSTSNQYNGIQFEHSKKMEGVPRLKLHGLDRVTTCTLNQIGETIGNALDLEEGKRKSMRDKKSDEELMQELMQKRIISRGKNNEEKKVQMDPETQLKVSRDVAIATAAKAKVLLRELKRVKADLDSAKKRCCELEEENKMLREGDHLAHDDDDDMIRIQLETLLAEKGRLAHENSVYARENRHLREIIEYHQLSMQDLVYWDDVTQEVQIDLSTPASVSASAWSRPTDPDTSQRPRLTTAKSV